MPGVANAERITSALGIPCSLQGEVQKCSGDLSTRVASWDGVPLDVDITLPPPELRSPYPTVVALHGWPLSKDLALIDDVEFARRGYAVVTYSARGMGLSCGLAISRVGHGCQKGWTHLADARYEARDTQYLAGLLADEGLARPRRIGVTGESYGGGQTLLLAALRDRVMRPGGRLVPWRSPAGRRMRVAAAAPRIGWTDLAYSLLPTGKTLDYKRRNPYGPRVGIPKQSWIDTLYRLGLASAYYAPQGADSDADLTSWYDRLAQGEPYGTRDVWTIIRRFKHFRSAYYLNRTLPRSERRRPAPILAYSAWTDDLFPPDELIRYANQIKADFRRADFGLIFADRFGHPRADLTARTAFIDAARHQFFDRYLLRDDSARPMKGVRVFTQGCRGQSVAGPIHAASWRRLHPGEVRFHTRALKSFDSAGGNRVTARLVDPVAPGQSSCRSTTAEKDPGAATYMLPTATGDGYTLLGSPTVVARLRTTGRFPQIQGRLWDVAPDGQQTLVARGSYRPKRHGRQVFQLHPNAWPFRPGYRPKLELLGQDAPYGRPPSANFVVRVTRLRLELPVHENPDGAAIRRYSPPGA